MPRLKDQGGGWLQRFKEEFSANRKRGEMTDVTLVCKDGSLPAHSLVLARISHHLQQTLASVVEKEEEGLASVILPDVTKVEVKTFLDCLYGEKVSGKNSKEIKAVKDIFSLLSGVKVSQDIVETVKEVAPSKTPEVEPHMKALEEGEKALEVPEKKDEHDESQIKESIVKTKVLLNKSDGASKERINVEEEKIDEGSGVVALRYLDPPEEEEKGNKEGNDVVASRYLGRQERAERLAAKLESLCQFCRNPVASHRVTIMAKEAVTRKVVCCMCGTVLANPSSFATHHKAEVKQRSGSQLPELWSFLCPICRSPLAEHRMQCCHCQVGDFQCFL